MLEWMMLLGIGFLAGCLLVVGLIPLIHNRAVRLTARKMLAATPLSVEELQAEKDLLRAEFAIANRRLELSIEEARAKVAKLLGEVGLKSAEIHQLRSELIALTPQPAELSRFSLSLLQRAS